MKKQSPWVAMSTKQDNKNMLNDKYTSSKILKEERPAPKSSRMYSIRNKYK